MARSCVYTMMNTSWLSLLVCVCYRSDLFLGYFYFKKEKEDPVLKTEEISEKPSAFIQEVAGRKPQDSDKVPTPMKPGLKRNVNNNSQSTV